MAGASTRDGHVIQKNGLPRKSVGLSRSTTNLSQAGLTVFEVDIETIKNSVRASEAPTNRYSDPFLRRPPSRPAYPTCPTHGPGGPETSVSSGYRFPNPANRNVPQQKLYANATQERSILSYSSTAESSDVVRWPYSVSKAIPHNGDTRLPPYSSERAPLPFVSRTNGHDPPRPFTSLVPLSSAPKRNHEPMPSSQSRYSPLLPPPRLDATSSPFQLRTAYSEISTSQSRISKAVPAVQAALPGIETQIVRRQLVNLPSPLFASTPEPLKMRKAAPSYQETFSSRNFTQYEPVGPLATGRCERVALGDTHFKDHYELATSLHSWVTGPITQESPAQRFPISRETPPLRSTPCYDSIFPSGPHLNGRNESSPSSRGMESSMSTTSTATLKERDIRSISSPVTAVSSPVNGQASSGLMMDEPYVHSVDRHRTAVACQFYMTQRMENVAKYQPERRKRRQQMETEMANMNFDSFSQAMLRALLAQRESNFLRLKRAQGTNKIGAKDFIKIRTIGEGAFGQVVLARKRESPKEACDLYAIKILVKSDVEEKNQFAHVKAERDILAEAENEWVVKLFYSFQDDCNLYLVMEYVPGGDLMTLLQIEGQFDEAWARFYTAELVCAIGSVHAMGFIHRDIKPDNILIDKDGHIKLTDFGLCTGFRWTHKSDTFSDKNGIHVRSDSLAYDKREPMSARNSKRGSNRSRKSSLQHRQFAHSQVGTPNYMAPEVIVSSSESGYTQVCDWWSLGVILYEMLCGRAPFYAVSPDETQRKVLDWRSHLRLSSHDLSKEAADLISRLCCEPENRLGNGQSELTAADDPRPVTILGAEEIKKHPFFRSVDWSSNIRQQTAPYIPLIKNPEDTSNFDDFDEQRSLFPTEAAVVRSSNMPQRVPSSNGLNQKNHQFYEFTFRRFFDSNLWKMDSEVLNTPVAAGSYAVADANSAPVCHRDEGPTAAAGDPEDSWILSQQSVGSSSLSELRSYSEASTRSSSSRGELLYAPPSYSAALANSDNSSTGSGNSQDNVPVFV